MNFITLFPGARNIELTKDVGMIPFILYKHYGYTASVACYQNGDYPYLDNEVKGLQLKIIKKYTGNEIIDSIIFLLKHAKQIDVLNLYHLSKKSCIFILFYKILNLKGKVYLKLDADYRIKDISYKVVKRIFFRILIKVCNFVSIESTKLQEYLKSYKIFVRYIPNGFYDYDKKSFIDWNCKYKIISTVGRIGTTQKANEVLLEAFKLAYRSIPGWQLMLIGPIEKDFDSYKEKFFMNNPELKDKILFTGPIYDKAALTEMYKKTSVFVLTSRWEGFPLVFPEALKNGCYIVSTNLDPAYDITNNETYGKLFNIDDMNALANILIDVCNNESLLKENIKKAQEFAYARFYWPTICENIHNYLNK